MALPLHASDKIIITGAAGLVGQNLCLMLRARGYTNIVAVDKRPENLATLEQFNPGVKVLAVDLAQPGEWSDAFADAKAVIQLHAHIGSLVPDEYVADNITATEHVLRACTLHSVPWLVHASSSVVNSRVQDDYTESKKAQEKLVLQSGIPHVILRPTLMFGWFDRKHLGWLSRFMHKSPVFPIPGSGNYLRQPLYVRDFCSVILACLQRKPDQTIYDISGAQEMSYLQMIGDIKRATASSTRIVRVPVWLFSLMLTATSLFTKHPPFTRKQMHALMAPDHFPLIPWWGIFAVTPTPWQRALDETFHHPDYSHVALRF